MRLRRTLALLSLFALACGHAAAQQELDEDREIERYRDVQQTMTEPVYRRLSVVHEDLAEDKYAEAKNGLDRMGRMALNDYEEALVLQTYGFVYVQQGQYRQAVDYFEKSLAMEALPGEAQQGMLYSLATLYAGEDQHLKAIETMRRWFRYEADPVPEAYMIIATSFVELERFDDALPYVQKAIERSEKPVESWYTLELAIYLESQRYRDAVDLLKRMVQIWPGSGKYWDMLASAHMELKEDKAALDTLMVAYANGLIDDGTRIMAIVQLNLVQEIPFTAGLMLEKEMAAGRIETNKRNLEILLQAWSMAKEYDRAISVIDRLGPLAEDGDYYMQKAGILNERGDWEAVIEAVAQALEKGVDKPADAHLLAGMAHAELKRYDEAMAAFRQARSLGNDDQRRTASGWIAFVREKQSLRRAAL